MKKLKFYFLAGFLFVSLLFILSACKKEYVKTPFNQIEEFSVTDSLGNKLKASLTGDSIIIYWPPFQTAPAQVTPQIAVASGATISPASGTKVAFAATTVYTITAQDGSKKTYKLVPLINQPGPVFALNDNATEVALGDYLNLRGQYFIPDTSQTKLYVVSSDNKNIPVSLKNVITFNSVFLSVQLPQDNSIDTGYYKIKLINGKNTGISGPYHFTVPGFPGVQFPAGSTDLKRGQTLTLVVSGPFAKYFYNSFTNAQAVLYIGDNWDTATMPVTSSGNGTLKLVIPSTAPLGKINGIDINDKDGNYIGNDYNLGAGTGVNIIQ